MTNATTPGWAVWFTGLPASGKSSVGFALQKQLAREGIPALVLDSDEVRRVLTPDATYDSGERDAFYGRLVELAALITAQGINVIIAATANRRAYRDVARKRLARFAEVWVRCPIDVCRARDPKGLYAQFSAGTLAQLPGQGAPYEHPVHPDAAIDTHILSIAAAVEAVRYAIPFLTPR